jgi:hypothetical protein
MSVRRWNDDASELRVPVISASDVGGVVTIAALIKLGTKTAFQTLLHGRDSGGVTRWVLGIDGTTGKPSLFTRFSAGFQYVQAADGLEVPHSTYCVVAVTVSDTITRRFHVIPLGGTAVHGASDLVGGMDPPSTTLGGYVSFGNQADASGSGLDGTMPVAAIWTDPLSDSEVAALATSLSSDAWANNAKVPAGAWNFDQSDRVDSVPDLTGHHATISGTLADLADTNGIAATTIVVDDPTDWNFTVTPPPLQVSVHLSGGSSNTDPLLSIGGAMSSALQSTTLFDDVSAAKRISGFTDYRLVYYRNDESVDVVASAYVGQQMDAHGTLAVGLATEAVNATVSAVADRFTAPAGVTFLTSGHTSTVTIPAGQTKGVWVRRIITAFSPEDATNPCEFDLDVDLA